MMVFIPFCHSCSAVLKLNTIACISMAKLSMLNKFSCSSAAIQLSLQLSRTQNVPLSSFSIFHCNNCFPASPRKTTLIGQVMGSIGFSPTFHKKRAL